MYQFRQFRLASMLMAASIATPNQRLIAAAPTTNSLTAIDVLLLPDETMVAHAKAVNARLRTNYPQGFALDATHRPHITLLQRYVRTKDLDAVYAAVERVLNRERPAGWKLEAIGYYYLDFDTMGLAGDGKQCCPTGIFQDRKAAQNSFSDGDARIAYQK